MPYDDDYDYHDDYLEEQAQEAWFQERLEANIEVLFDEYLPDVFRSNVSSWSAANWPQAEQLVYRLGLEARDFASRDLHAPAVVWSATCIEIMFRELILKPSFVGFGGTWGEVAIKAIFGGRWVSQEALAVAKAAMLTVAALNVEAIDVDGLKPWGEIRQVLDERNAVVHRGRAASAEEAANAVAVAAALYQTILPPLRRLSGLDARDDYAPPEGGTPF